MVRLPASSAAGRNIHFTHCLHLLGTSGAGSVVVNFKSMRIIFVGICNKPGLPPLAVGTKTGKLVSRIIGELPEKRPWILRTNLFEVEHLPSGDEATSEKKKWLDKYHPEPDDIIVLLGQMTHCEFPEVKAKIIKVPHPASMRSHEQMNAYVERVSNAIKELL